ncbi:MinD/ParA family protein [uncultured Desulfovibrio sp.]|uniref:MinD/ParA family protein n=1 Tax=uncultured Desulfovibrio sp. TaxID=167968 RepID=UPI00262A3DFA|nr:MinD/ParA family protein [uncultured Desulfovibrio sp.]
MANKTLSIAVMSGKGGVGKTNLSLNLACGLHQAGYSALLMDCDLGLANLDVLLGIMPEGNLQHALMGDVPLKKILHPVEPRGFDVLPAASGVPELVDLSAEMQGELLQKLEPVFAAYDYVIMDLGAGISRTVQFFAAMAAMRLVIITPEPTSLTDSYAFMKVLHARHEMRDFKVVVNQASSAKEAQNAFDKLKGACKHFLHFEPEYLGHVRTDPKLPEAVCRQQPLMRYAPGSPAAQDMEKLAARLQKHRLNMLDWLAQRPVLQAPLL